MTTLQPLLAALFSNEGGNVGLGTIILWGVVLLVLFITAIIVLNFGMIWIRALTSGAPVKISELIALRLRGVPVGLIVDNRITAVKSGLAITIDDLSTHFLAGGNVQMVIQALIAARKALCKCRMPWRSFYRKVENRINSKLLV